MESKEYKDGLTVKELKELIKDWPEEDVYGETTEVWIQTGVCLSSPVFEVNLLNFRTCDNTEWADILLKVGDDFKKS